MAIRHIVNDKTPEDAGDDPSYLPRMDDDSNEAIGERLSAARRKLGLTQNAVAKMLGVDQSTLGHWERGRGNPGYQQARKLESILGVTADWLIYGRMSQRDEEIMVRKNPFESFAPQKADVDLSKATPIREGKKDLPVFGSVKGSFDGSEIDYHYPVEFIGRPDILMGVKDACACYVVNESMEPRYFAGERLLVHPGKPVKSGDFVVVELAEHKGIVKRLVRRSDDYVELEQLNPPKREKIPRQHIVGVHKIVGTLND